ncbi:MAG: VirB8/TrbF family protein [Sphingobium sp.]
MSQVKWTETAYERGNEAGSSHWTGILTILTKPPVSADTLRKNPLGIYIDAIDWSPELEPAASTAAARIAQSPSNVPLGSPLDPNLAAQSTANPETQP